MKSPLMFLILSVSLFYYTLTTDASNANAVHDPEMVEILREHKERDLTTEEHTTNFINAALVFDDTDFIHIPEELLVIKDDERTEFEEVNNSTIKSKLEEHYELVTNPVVRGLFKQIKFYERKVIHKDLLKIIIYRMMTDDSRDAMPKYDKYYYYLVAKEIHDKSPEIIETHSVYDYIMGDIFHKAVEDVIIKNFGRSSLNVYKDKMKEDDL